jgi:hypothetical protein
LAPPHPSSLPEQHRAFIDRAVKVLAGDARIVGIAAAGSYADDNMDECSDIDLVIAVEPQHHTEIMTQRKAIAASLGTLLGAFTGEHVGEPRLLICLYGPPLLHVDLKFVSLPDAAPRVDDPVILWERGARLTDVYASTPSTGYPKPDAQWIEDRFWIWVHYVAGKIERGECFEALESLSFFRTQVLGPLMRRIESNAPALAAELTNTIATHDRRSLLGGLRACVATYQRIRARNNAAAARSDATLESAVLAYLENLSR